MDRKDELDTLLAGAGIEAQQVLDLAAYLTESEPDAGKVRKYLHNAEEADRKSVV